MPRNGLPHPNVLSLHQDQRGFLWFGTEDGLGFYDGYNILPILKSKRYELINNHITCIAEDTAGRLWLGTENGLSRFDFKTQRFINFQHNSENPNSLPEGNILSLLPLENGKIWVGTETGLGLLDPEQGHVKRYSLPDLAQQSLSYKHVQELALTADGSLWLGTPHGLFRLLPEATEFKVYDQVSFTNTAITGLITDPQGKLWVATRQGLHRYLTAQDGFESYLHQTGDSTSLISNFVNALTLSPQGDIWIVTDVGLSHLPKGKSAFKNYSFQAFRESTNLGSLQSILVDKSGIIWVGTREQGVLKVDLQPKKFKAIRDHAGGGPLHEAITWSVAKTSDGALWTATGKGLIRLAPQRESSRLFVHDEEDKNSLSANNLSRVFVDHKNRLWVGTHEAGLNLLKNATSSEKPQFTSFRSDLLDSTTLNFDAIHSIFVDSKERLWVGTLLGLNLAQLDESGIPGGFTHFNRDPKDSTSLSDDLVHQVYESQDGTLWLATNKGLNRVIEDPKTGAISFKAYKEEDDNSASLPDNKVRAIEEGKPGELWVGTASGLVRFDTKSETFEAIEDREGYARFSVAGMLYEKEHETLWLSSEEGLIKYHVPSNSFKYYKKEDGIQGETYHIGAFSKARDGEFLFGGLKGIDAFYPNALRKNSHTPKVTLTDLRVFSQSMGVNTPQSPLKAHIAYTEELKLSHEQYLFSLELSALNFRNTSENQYAVFLEGFDEEWRYLDQQRLVSYSNLSPGTYTLHLKAANSEGFWGAETQPLTLKITPPIWKEPLFLGAIFIVFMSLTYSLYRLRVRSIRKQNMQLERLVKKRTSEVIEKNFELESQKNQVERSFENIRVLSEIGREITAVLDLQEVVSTVYQHVNVLMDAEVFGVCIYHPQDEKLHYLSYIDHGESKTLPAIKLKEDSPWLEARCVLAHQTLFIEDFPASDYYDAQRHGEVLGNRPKLARSLIFLPLFVQGRILGVVTVQSDNPKAYTDYHLNMLESLATYIATGLENSNSYQKINLQKHEIEARNKAITDSINYAKRIQEAMLLTAQEFQEELPDGFIFFRPRDIVSGDFYWVARRGKELLVAAADCTGHGVPGAFMSMAGYAYLNQHASESENLSAAEILENLDISIRQGLHQRSGNSKDGMEIALCILNPDTQKLQFSGANRPLLFVENGEWDVVKPTKRPIGGNERQVQNVFENHSFALNPKRHIYLFSDGYQDQFGGPEGRKYLKKRLYNLLALISELPGKTQEEKLGEALDGWMGSERQVDDILILGFNS